MQKQSLQASQYQRDQDIFFNKPLDEDQIGVPDVNCMASDNACDRNEFPSKLYAIQRDHDTDVHYCTWSPNGKHLATVSKERICVWRFCPVEYQIERMHYIEKVMLNTTEVKWSPNSTTLAICAQENYEDVSTFLTGFEITIQTFSRFRTHKCSYGKWTGDRDTSPGD